MNSKNSNSTGERNSACVSERMWCLECQNEWLWTHEDSKGCDIGIPVQTDSPICQHCGENGVSEHSEHAASYHHPAIVGGSNILSTDSDFSGTGDDMSEYAPDDAGLRCGCEDYPCCGH